MTLPAAPFLHVDEIVRDKFPLDWSPTRSPRKCRLGQLFFLMLVSSPRTRFSQLSAFQSSRRRPRATLTYSSLLLFGDSPTVYEVFPESHPESKPNPSDTLLLAAARFTPPSAANFFCSGWVFFFLWFL